MDVWLSALWPWNGTALNCRVVDMRIMFRIEGTYMQPGLVPDDPPIMRLSNLSGTPESLVSGGFFDMDVPIRICPHCGYEIRTWILGDLTCTRCENDIHIGKGKELILYFRASDMSCDTGLI